MEYGEWAKFCRDKQMPFSKSKAEMLIIIANALEHTPAHLRGHLPKAWNSLYYVARLGRRVIERLVSEGRITPELPIREARALLVAHDAQACRKTKATVSKLRLAQFAKFVQSSLPSWSTEERQTVKAELLQLANTIA
jgi:hypothetical protein